MAQVSAVIPSYNSAATVGRTVASLLAQKPASALKEVIVVDSSQDGKTPQLLDSIKDPRLKIVHLKEKTMPAIGRNIGAKEASGDVLGFVDSDAYAGEDWAAKILEAYAQGCRVGGGSLHLPPEQRRNPLALVQYFIQFNEFMETGERRAVRFTPSCNLFCEKKLFTETGGFPEIRAAEDVLFGLGLAGKEAFWFEPKLRVWHIFLDTWQRYRSNQVLLGQYTLEYRRQHYKKWIYRGIWPIVFLPIFLGGKFLKIAWRVCKCPDNELRFAFFLYLPLFLVGMVFLGWGVAKTCFKEDK